MFGWETNAKADRDRTLDQKAGQRKRGNKLYKMPSQARSVLLVSKTL